MFSFYIFQPLDYSNFLYFIYYAVVDFIVYVFVIQQNNENMWTTDLRYVHTKIIYVDDTEVLLQCTQQRSYTIENSKT